MDKEGYKQLLISLKKCELNYHAHVREFGKLGKPEISFWTEALNDFTADKIKESFDSHINDSSFFPTVKDIREGTLTNPKRMPCEDHKYLSKLEDEKRLLPQPDRKPVGMPDEMKVLLKLYRAAEQKQTLKEFRAELKTTVSD